MTYLAGQKKIPLGTYVVLNLRGHVPTVAHNTYRQAKAEATRLAQANPKDVFIILRAHAMLGVELDPPKPVVQVQALGGDDDALPF